MSNPMQHDTQQITVSVTELKPGPFQSRQYFDPQQLLELAQTIANDGLINPPLVMANGKGYHIIAGERRWRAISALALTQSGDIDLSRAIERVAAADGPAYIAGRKTLRSHVLPVRLAQGDAASLHVAAVVDNHQRANLNPIEEARDFAGLIERYGWSVWQTGRRVGRSDAFVRGRLRLLDLEPEIQDLIAAGRLIKDITAVEAILGVPDATARIKLARRFAERKATAKAIVNGCTRVVDLMQKQAQAAATQPTVSVQQATLRQQPVAAPITVTPAAPRHCLSDESKEYISALAEELCGSCAVNGLTTECLTCPGVIEFIEQLVKAAQC